MRLILAFCLIAPPALAWEFSPAPICTLTHDSDEGQIVLTYDPALPLYAVTVTLADGTWPEAGPFGMAFAGGRAIAIQTDRHRISPDGRSLTVTDSGFGNVLDGLEYNARAYAMAGEQTFGLSLDGIGPAITAFRACAVADMA
jgi:hypothetical protein